jgi:hypothetical protein
VMACRFFSPCHDFVFAFVVLFLPASNGRRETRIVTMHQCELRVGNDVIIKKAQVTIPQQTRCLLECTPCLALLEHKVRKHIPLPSSDAGVGTTRKPYCAFVQAVPTS